MPGRPASSRPRRRPASNPPDQPLLHLGGRPGGKKAGRSRAQGGFFSVRAPGPAAPRRLPAAALKPSPPAPNPKPARASSSSSRQSACQTGSRQWASQARGPQGGGGMARPTRRAAREHLYMAGSPAGSEPDPDEDGSPPVSEDEEGYSPPAGDEEEEKKEGPAGGEPPPGPGTRIPRPRPSRAVPCRAHALPAAETRPANADERTNERPARSRADASPRANPRAAAARLHRRAGCLEPRVPSPFPFPFHAVPRRARSVLPAARATANPPPAPARAIRLAVGTAADRRSAPRRPGTGGADGRAAARQVPWRRGTCWRRG